MRRSRSTLSDQDGMTLVELMVAAFVLVVGMLAVAGVVSSGMGKTTRNNQRVAATNLGRELTEAARIATYQDLTAAGARQAVQAASTALGTGTPWQVTRRNTLYTIAVSACTYDDPADTLATPAVADRCALPAGTATTTGDQNGDDFRRVTFTVSWRTQGKTESLTQTALVVNPSGGLGPRIIPPLPVIPTITSPTQASVSFPITTTTASSLHFNVDDGLSTGDASGGPTSWTVLWPIGTSGTAGSMVDGTYTIGLQAFSDRGIPGDARAVEVTLNRAAPFAPTGFAGGHDTRDGDWVDLEWSLNAERDIIGYRVYDAGPDKAVGGGDDRLACPTAAGTWLRNTTTTCQDTSPPSGSAAYYLVALDRDASGQPRQGTATLLQVGGPNGRPLPPQSVTLDVGPSVTWTAPTSGSIAFYRVYRDGTSPADRIGRLPASPYVDDSGGTSGAHDYWVSAVDDKFNESDLVGPLHWSG